MVAIPLRQNSPQGSKWTTSESIRDHQPPEPADQGLRRTPTSRTQTLLVRFGNTPSTRWTKRVDVSVWKALLNPEPDLAGQESLGFSPQNNFAGLAVSFHHRQATPAPGFSSRLLVALRAHGIRVSHSGNRCGTFDLELDEVLRLGIANPLGVSQLDGDITQILPIRAQGRPVCLNPE